MIYAKSWDDNIPQLQTSLSMSRGRILQILQLSRSSRIPAVMSVTGKLGTHASSKNYIKPHSMEISPNIHFSQENMHIWGCKFTNLFSGKHGDLNDLLLLSQ